jgi:hypothetical protein
MAVSPQRRQDWKEVLDKAEGARSQLFPVLRMIALTAMR